MITEKSLKHPSRAPSPVPSAFLQNEPTNQSLPRLPLPNQRRSSFSHHDQHEEKPLITHRSFPHLNSSRNKQRRGSETTVINDAESVPAIRFASDKRNNDFHALFRSVPEHERLIDDYGCALQKEILLQGRIYISEHHLCFNANIFGWITNLVIAFEDVQDIEKKSTAIFIPNAILISTCSSKHFFASFLSRDQAFDQMVDLWKAYRAASNNASTIENQTAVSIHSNIESDYSSDYSYSEDEADTPNTSTSSHIQDKHTFLKSSLASLPTPKHVVDDSAARRRAISESGSRPNELPDYDEAVSKSLASLNSSADTENQSREKTQCECSRNDQHFPTTVMDNIYNTSIETMYGLLFNSSFMAKFLGEVEKSTDICIGEWIKTENCVHSRESSYVKYLGGSIGPKSTKCYLKEQVLHLDTSDYISQLTVTQTPDVPAGSSFNVKTKTCISWSGQGQVRVLVTVLVEFTKSSWLKSTIEKASIDGQQNFYKNLDVAIRKYLHTQQQVHRPHKASVGRRRRRASTKRRQRHTSHPQIEQQQQQQQQQQQPMTPQGHFLSDCVSWIIDHLSTLTMTQLTTLCMIIMVTTNLYIAARLAGLDNHLSQLQHRPPTGGISITDHQQDTLWEILGKYDPETKAHDHMQLSKHTLDKKIVELEKMILRAGYNMNHIAQLIQDQKIELNKQ